MSHSPTSNSFFSLNCKYQISKFWYFVHYFCCKKHVYRPKSFYTFLYNPFFSIMEVEKHGDAKSVQIIIIYYKNCRHFILFRFPSLHDFQANGRVINIIVGFKVMKINMLF